MHHTAFINSDICHRISPSRILCSITLAFLSPSRILCSITLAFLSPSRILCVIADTAHHRGYCVPSWVLCTMTDTVHHSGYCDPSLGHSFSNLNLFMLCNFAMTVAVPGRFASTRTTTVVELLFSFEFNFPREVD